jgi:phosphatidylserine/phosphatidylglycerophosphate/cardiolipin synthase-like enzyme
MDNNSLAILISDFVQTTPPEMIGDVATEIERWGDESFELRKDKIISSIIGPQTKSKLSKLIDCWVTECPSLTAIGLATSIRSASVTFQTSRAPKTELIWTGPAGSSINFRRTDQALLELISGAKEHLLIVSFAVYKAKPIIDAIEDAIRRGVKVVICLEDTEEGKGKLTISGLKTFSSSIFRLASVYVWPLEKRPHNVDGMYGSLHAKIAVADRGKVFISSANLTDFAMDLNIELGVMVEGGDLPANVSRCFEDLITNKVFIQRKM